MSQACFCCCLVVVATGCASHMQRRGPGSISNADVTQLQPAVHSSSFTMRDADATRQLAGGVYQREKNEWRWTAGDFSVVLAAPQGASTSSIHLVFEFFIPDANLRRTGPVTVTAYLNQAEIGKTTYTAAGAQRFFAKVPPGFIDRSPAVIDFHLDRKVPGGALDTRELGVVALAVRLERE